MLKRHTAGHTADEADKRQRRANVRASRVIQACEACSQNHLRCEDEKPCNRCQKKGIECRIPATEGTSEIDTVHAAQDLLDLSSNLGRTPSNSHESSSYSESLETNTNEQSLDMSNSITSPAHTLTQNGTSEQHHELIDSGIQTSYYEELPLPYEGSPSTGANHSFLPDYFRHMPPFESSFSGQATPRGIMDLSFNWDIDLNDMDMGFLDQYNSQIPFNVETPSTDTQGPQQNPSPEVSRDSMAVRHEAFKKSVWRYIPQSDRDFGAAEEPNLAFTDAERDNGFHRPKLISRRAIQDKLDRVTRDRLMALVLSTCSPSNISRIAGAFPSIDLLDGLIQYFLTSPSIDARTWFHLPTLSLSKLRSELLASIAAAGAVSTPDVPLRKLGFALQEASRAGQAQAFEADNSAIRDLQHIQNLLLQLEIGMWSGVSRKMEIAESFLQPLVTMLRRGGRFRRSIWKEIIVTPDDDGKILEDKWRQWIRQESYLRLVHRAFKHDRQASLALLKPPLISYAEMQLPLPHPDSIWNAPSANAWKAAYLGQPLNFAKRPSPADCLLNLDHLSRYESASSTYLHMTWGMIWEYRQMATLTGRSQTAQTNSLILSSRHQELTKYLEDFRVGSSVVSQASRLNATVLLELMLLHLNAPLDEIQLFAGIDGHDEARRAYPALKEWVDTSTARQGLWHAGQTLRACSSLSRGLLRNFYAIAAYHAGLVLWAYGFIKRENENSIPTPSNDFLVCLDGDNNLDVRRFVTLDRGMPALQGGDDRHSPVQVNNISGTMDAVTHILRANHDAMEECCPPLVDNLVQLMEGLKSTTR